MCSQHCLVAAGAAEREAASSRGEEEDAGAGPEQVCVAWQMGACRSEVGSNNALQQAPPPAAKAASVADPGPQWDFRVTAPDLPPAGSVSPSFGLGSQAPKMSQLQPITLEPSTATASTPLRAAVQELGTPDTLLQGARELSELFDNSPLREMERRGLLDPPASPLLAPASPLLLAGPASLPAKPYAALRKRGAEPGPSRLGQGTFGSRPSSPLAFARRIPHR